MDQIMLYAPFYERIIEEYHADIYTKGTIYLERQNWLLKSVPTMFRFEKGIKDYIIETASELHYAAPNIYDQRVKAIASTFLKNKGIPSPILEYFSMNIYSQALLKDRLLSPVSPHNRKYYTYKLDSVVGRPGERLYYIRFTPRNWSRQLIKGSMVVSDQIWSVREMSFRGESKQITFTMHLTMGEEGAKDEFLPVLYDAELVFRFLGNQVEGTYSTHLTYEEVKLNELHRKFKRRKKYDLTDSFVLQCDTNALKTDFGYLAEIRPIPLTPVQDSVYMNYFQKQNTTDLEVKIKKPTKVFWGEMGDFLIQNYTVDLASAGSVCCSPLINPFLLSYSGNNGLSYRQEFKYSRLIKGDRLLRIVPRIGYNFTRNEFYWRIHANFDYWPAKRASVHLDVGNGNRISNTMILDELKEMPDSVSNFDDIDFKYYKGLYVKARHSVEVYNGLTVSVGFAAHRRTPAKKLKLSEDIPDETEEDINELVRDEYRSFAPNIQLQWTPGLYYYMDGKRKINFRSKYPTFTFDWERGIKGLFRGDGNYERIEIDMQHKIPLTLLKSLYYRVGAGAYTNQEEIYFIDFANLARNNLPQGWNDDIGGTFQLLDRRWFNTSHKYIRGNITYEAPFLVLRHLGKYVGYVQNERFYINALLAPRLTPYVELGYGVGTHVFDVGVFVSSDNGKFHRIGCKFTFELFTK
ncbi:MAG: DUF5686 family protein [Bacteroides sp.]|nr:DUF5686 family protein [Bacteroides sp.]